MGSRLDEKGVLREKEGMWLKGEGWRLIRGMDIVGRSED